MSFVTWEGSQPINQYLSPHASHLILSHVGLADQLLLSQHDEKPYEYYPTGWNQSDGRSLLGAVRVKGGNYQKDLWECNFHALKEQVDLFNLLLQFQQYSASPVSLVDRWVDGTVVTKNVWLQVDRQYLSLVAAGWWRLQFQAWEV